MTEFKPVPDDLLTQRDIAKLVPEEPSEESELKNKKRIFVPETWASINPLKYVMSSDKGRKVLEDMAEYSREFLAGLTNSGIDVVFCKSTDGIDLGENGYVLDQTGHIERDEEKKVVSEVAPEIEFSDEITTEEYLKNPFWPVVVKGKEHGGKNKFFLESNLQVNNFLRFLEEEGHNLKEGFFSFSHFIQTPSDRYTSYRILVTAKGKILASALFGSQSTKSKPEYLTPMGSPESLGAIGSDLTDYLTNPASPYYVQSKKIISNIAGGGKLVPLNPTEQSKPIDDEDRQLLQEHGIESQQLPEVLANASSAIAKKIGRKTGLVMGIDFMQDIKGKFHYLETNIGPGADTYLAAKNKGEGELVDGYRMMMEEVLADFLEEE